MTTVTNASLRQRTTLPASEANSLTRRGITAQNSRPEAVSNPNLEKIAQTRFGHPLKFLADAAIRSSKEDLGKQKDGLLVDQHKKQFNELDY